MSNPDLYEAQSSETAEKRLENALKCAFEGGLNTLYEA